MIATIDFEASALDGFPIEVGVAIYDHGRRFISVWSSLIRPPRAWLRTMDWDPGAENLHSITQADLQTAPTAFDVARQLNGLLSPLGVAYCDGIPFDERWLRVLMEECPDACGFRLGNLLDFARRLNLPLSASFDQEERRIAHRAAADAERLLRHGLELAFHA